MSIIHVNEKNFQQEVMESRQPVLLDFWAPWCGPCKMMSGVLDEIAEERPDIKICKANIDEEWALANRFRIVTIPTLMVVEDGQIKSQFSGARPKAQVLEML